MSEERGHKNIVGGNIKKRRESSRISQKELVEMLNVMGHKMTPSTISKIETGNRGVSDMELWSISMIFRCSVNDLFG